LGRHSRRREKAEDTAIEIDLSLRHAEPYLKGLYIFESHTDRSEDGKKERGNETAKGRNQIVPQWKSSRE